MINQYYKVGNGGFIGLKDYLGSDSSICLAARTSYNRGTKTLRDDEQLINYLIRKSHSSPTEFAEIIFHIKAPLFLIQQILRHRTGNFCQESHRYSIIGDDKFIVDEWRGQSQTNKQSSEGVLPSEDQELLFKSQQKLHELSETVYNERIEMGVSRELARTDIPHSTYSELYFKMDLNNIFKFLKLRLDPHAQQEIREYAYVMACFVKQLYPMCFSAFERYVLYSQNFSQLELEMLEFCMYENIQNTTKEECTRESILENRTHIEPLLKLSLDGAISNREISEFFDKLKPAAKQPFDISKLEEFIPT